MNAVHRHIASRTFAFILAMAVAYGATAFVLNRVVIKGRRAIAHVNPTAVRLGGQEYEMTRDFDPASHYDVLVVGSSHAYRGYDPRVFELNGYRLFNAGSSAQHPTVSALVLQTMLPQLSHKPLVIIDVFDRILEMDGGESTGRMMTNCADPDLAARILRLRMDVTALNTYAARYLAPNGMSETELKDYVRDGYCTRDGQLQRDLDSLPSKFKSNEQAMKGLSDALHWLAANGYRSVLVSHPMPPQQGRDTFHQGAVEAIERMNSDLRVPYFDFTMHDFGEQWKTYFWDATHLNQRGVDRFNALLVDTLRSTGYLSMK